MVLLSCRVPLLPGCLVRRTQVDRQDLARCQQVAKKLARKDWTPLYDCVALVITEVRPCLEALSWADACVTCADEFVCAWRAHDLEIGHIR